MSSFSEDEIARAHEVYDSCVDLVDTHLASYDATGDDTSLGTETARYSLLDQPTAGSMPQPYSAVLEKTSVVVMQRISQHEGAAERNFTRKIELLDPFKVIGSAGLLLVVLNDTSIGIPEMPEALVLGEAVEALMSPAMHRPLYAPQLTDNLEHLVHTIRSFSEAGRLAPISMNDVQSMYRLQYEVGPE